MTKNRQSSNGHAEKPDFFKFKSSPTLVILLVALSLLIGYFVGTYHFQIEGFVASIISNKSVSTSLDFSSLQETYVRLAQNYDGKLNVQSLIDGANKGMVEAVGDDYTIYMTPSEAEEYNKDLSGDVGSGIGAVIGKKNGLKTILSVLADNPAKAAGLLAGDIILEVNDQSVMDWTVNQTVSEIRGDVGTTVKIKIRRGSEDKEFVITRAVINNPSVTSDIKGEVGVITISRFDLETGSLVEKAAKSFAQKGIKKVVVDLRDNPGGYVDAAVSVAGVWLDNKIVVTERSGDVVTETMRTGSKSVFGEDVKTVILVNYGTASASEIVSGALHDYGRATLVGMTTFGKGSVQKLINLSSGAELKVTIANWYTPNGINISKSGLKPDIEADLTEDDYNADRDPQMDAAINKLNE